MKNNIFKATLIAPLACLTFGVLSSCNQEIKADLVVFNNIFTAENENDSAAEAFAVKDGKYIFVGSKEEATKYIKEGATKVIDGDNKGLVIPGATEGHAHYFGGVGLNSQLPGSGKSYSQVLEILKQKVSEGITQFVSFGWNSTELTERKEKGDNFAEEIEKIAPGIPVVLIDNSGHGAVCNKTALKKAGIEKGTVIRGGLIGVDKNGEPSGYLGDQLTTYVLELAIAKPLNDDQYKNACEYGMNELLKLGYTNAVDAFTNMYDPTGLYKALKNMDDSGDLKINLVECFNICSYDSEIYRTKVNQVRDIVKNYSSSHLHPNYIKLFADGIVEGGTGWVIEPYSDGTHGNIIWNQPELDAITSYANHNGILIHAHTYGDAACRAMLDSFINSNEINGNQYRNCLAHVRNITDEDIDRASSNKISVAANLLWHTDYDKDDPFRKKIIDNIGESRYEKGYQMKTLMDKGVNVSSSTDAPAAATLVGSILNVIEVSVTGQEPESTAEPFAPSELLSVKESLKALTINGAWQIGLEKERGSIKVGKYADFVILDKNILNYQGEQLRTIHDTNILSTYFEGEEVYRSN